MKAIKKFWVRVLISLFIGGMFAEIMHIKTGDASVRTSNKYVFTIGIIAYILMTVLLRVLIFFKYWRESKPIVDDDILDN